MLGMVVKRGRVRGRRISRAASLGGEEVTAFCPTCKALQTLWFTGDRLVQTRKYFQDGARVYHDCGSDEPCRLLPGYVKKA